MSSPQGMLFISIAGLAAVYVSALRLEVDPGFASNRQSKYIALTVSEELSNSCRLEFGYRSGRINNGMVLILPRPACFNSGALI